MQLRVVGAGVGRTGTHSLKLALEQLLGGPCHHMIECFGNERTDRRPGPTRSRAGRSTGRRPARRYRSLVDWPGASFWPELSAANPDALVLLSVRDPDAWYRSVSNTIFLAFDNLPPEMQPWMNTVRKLFHDRFSDRLENPTAMMDAFERHNAAVRNEVPASRLLEWTASDGWAPICERLGLAVPDEPFPVTNTTDEFRTMLGMPPT